MKKKDLTAEQCETALTMILNDADPHQIAAFLVLLHAKGESADELFAFVQVMRKKMHSFTVSHNLLDIVGTGGDGAHTINISTAASILAASCGVKVAKHGNRSVSSQCGSADLLQELQIKIDLQSEQIVQCIEDNNIGFCFAPLFHPAMQQLKTIRTALGVRTTLNLLGPLLNPANARHYLIGVSNERYMSIFAEVLMKSNVTHALIVHGNGLDELSLLGPSKVIEVRGSDKKEFVLDPIYYGFKYSSIKAIRGGTASANAKLILDAFNGKKGPIADTIILNAGTGLYAADYVDSIEVGIDLARTKLNNGGAMQILTDWIATCKKF